MYSKNFVGFLISFFYAQLIIAQGTFQNLNFESSNLSPIPAGQYGGFVSTAQAIPDWTAYIGNQAVTQILQNDSTLGSPGVAIDGPNWNGNTIIEGEYSIVLEPGNLSVSISQTGIVPANAESLEFKADAPAAFSVSLGNDNLTLFPLGTGANYTLYGANIPQSFAGQQETLTVSALAGPFNSDIFDSFAFSGSTVTPEPSPFALTAIGGVLFALHRRFVKS